jgi:hypothetical protein
MAKHNLRTGKKSRPKTSVKGKRYRCARCRKRSPRPVKTPAPWYCNSCNVQAPVGLPQPRGGPHAKLPEDGTAS